MNKSFLLYEACRFGLLPVVKLLLADHKYRSGEIQTTFITSAIHGHLEVVKYAVEKGANVWCHDEGSLGLLSAQGQSEVVEYIKSVQRGVK
jgi:hypothetical protein